jgi:hypothetical protein
MDLLNLLKREKGFLFLIFIFSLIINSLFFNIFLKPNKDYYRGDTPWYHETAIQIANGDGVTDQDGVSNYYRVPGYSIFLAICYKLFDFDNEKALLVQMFLSAFIPILIFFLSLIFFPGSLFVAKLSSFLFVFNFGSWLYAGFLMTEILFLILFLLYLILFFSYIKLTRSRFIGRDDTKKKIFFSRVIPPSEQQSSPYFLKLIFAGFFLGVASLIRPVGHYVIILSVFILLISKLSKANKIKSSLILFFSWVLIVSPWIIRNYNLTGNIFFHAMPGNHFLTYLASDVKSIAEDKSFLFSKNELLSEWESKTTDSKNYYEVCKKGEKISYKIFKKHPLITLKRCFVNFFKTIFGFHVSVLLDRYSENFVGYDTAVTIFEKIKLYLFPKVKNKFFIFFVYYEILWMLFYLGFLGFLFISLFNKNLFFVSLANFLFVGLFVFLTLGIGLARLRYPIEPILTILSTYFWKDFFSHKLFLKKSFK